MSYGRNGGGCMAKKTEWYPGSVKPARVGVYECQDSTGKEPYYCFWNGEFWSAGEDTPLEAMAFARKLPSVMGYCQDKVPWRGLASDPNGKSD